MADDGDMELGPELFERLSKLKEKIFDAEGKLHPGATAIEIQDYNNLRKALQANNQDVSQFPLARLPKATGLTEDQVIAFERDPNLAWDVRRGKALV